MVEELGPITFQFDAIAAELSALGRCHRCFHAGDVIVKNNHLWGAGAGGGLVGNRVAALSRCVLSGARGQHDGDVKVAANHFRSFPGSKSPKAMTSEADAMATYCFPFTV